ncbi:MAG: hypothetical protein R2932_03180 [Caldilineaceae bacterium]
MHEFRESIINFDETDADFNQAYGLINITEDQQHLKRINWEIHYLSAEGVEDKFIRNFWLHEDSMYWEQYGVRDMSFMSQGEEE